MIFPQMLDPELIGRSAVERTELRDRTVYVSCVLGDKLRITMSSIMRWRRREIGLVIDGLLSTALHERAILADRRLPTDDQNPIEMTDGSNRRLQQVRQSSFKTIKINILNLGQRPRPRRLPRQRFSAMGFMECCRISPPSRRQT
jgi:hypothetical protein